ncbi:MAG: transcription antitermination factor NusB [Eubacterium sp.]|nr:transcription antitermination factor NusB [Candidatus Colimonas fimequi]
MNRKQARETMMQMLFEMETANEITAEKAEAICSDRINGKELARATDILKAIAVNIENIDSTINEYSKSWKTNRMPKVDLAILRLAIGEARYADDVSTAVVVSEAINLAKKFSTDQSSSFIHGVLGAIFKNEQ